MRFLVALSTSLVVLGCGGGGATQTPPEGQSSLPPDEPVDAVEDPGQEPADEPFSEPEPSGPVEVTVALRVGNDDASGEIQVLNASGEAVHEGSSGDTFTIPSGDYSVVAHITNERVMIDTPTITQEDVHVPFGEPHTVEVRFPVARIRLNVRRNGRPLRRGSVKLYRQGEETPVAQFRLSNDHVAVSPGRYEADVQTGQMETRVRGLTFMDGATQNIPVDSQ